MNTGLSLVNGCQGSSVIGWQYSGASYWELEGVKLVKITLSVSLVRSDDTPGLPRAAQCGTVAAVGSDQQWPRLPRGTCHRDIRELPQTVRLSRSGSQSGKNIITPSDKTTSTSVLRSVDGTPAFHLLILSSGGITLTISQLQFAQAQWSADLRYHQHKWRAENREWNEELSNVNNWSSEPITRGQPGTNPSM